MNKLNELALNVEEITKDTDLAKDKSYISDIIKKLENNEIGINDASSVIKNFITIISKCESSLENRDKQLLSDKKIVDIINKEIDSFRCSTNQNFELTIRDINSVIDSELQNYKNEIINKLDPYKIAQFKTQSDFQYWLEAVNNNYLSIFNKKIGRNIDIAIKKYVYEVERVIVELDNHLSSRENYIDFEDEVYGSLSKSKKAIVKSTKTDIIVYAETGKNLTQASIKLYDNIRNTKYKHDMRIEATTVTGGALGATAGLVSHGAVVTALEGIKLLSFFAGPLGTAITLATTIVGALVVGNIAKSITEGTHEKDMLKEIEECRRKFVEQIDNVQLEIQEKTKLVITSTFDNEIISMEKSFLKFRMIVNIDNEKIDMLKSKIIETKDLIESINDN